MRGLAPLGTNRHTIVSPRSQRPDVERHEARHGSYGHGSMLVQDLAALDRDRLAVADCDPEPAVAVDQLGGSRCAVDGDGTAAQEVPRSEPVVHRIETTLAPLLVP